MNRQTMHTTGSAELGERTVLVLATETLEGVALRDVIRADGAPPAGVVVIAPSLNSRLRHWMSDEDDARRSAGRRLSAPLERLRAGGIEAEGLVGDADPLQAIADALQRFEVQRIVIATRPQGRSHWLARDLSARARRRFAQPGLNVVVEPSEASTPRSGSMTTRRRAVRPKAILAALGVTLAVIAATAARADAGIAPASIERGTATAAISRAAISPRKATTPSAPHAIKAGRGPRRP
jgi:hypothetical protein